MKQTAKLLAAGIAAVAAGMAVAGATTTAATSGDGPIRCEIRTEKARGLTHLVGVVATDAPISGTYRFHIEGGGRSGNTNISQGGAFAAEPGSDFELGKVMLGNPGGVYDASLDLRVMGKNYSCEARIGSI
jgi:hypothetical protein